MPRLPAGDAAYRVGRLSTRACNHNHHHSWLSSHLNTSASSLRRTWLTTQTRVLQTTTLSSTRTPSLTRPLPVFRSPHQWSHIVHHSRNPAFDHESLSKTHKRSHMGHSHGHGGHHHHHDNTYLTSKNSNDPGVKITRMGLYVNLGMAIAKGMGGYIFNSQALTADALHALTDLVSDITTLATISYSLKAATDRFPLGYGKIESLGALGVSGLLLSGGIMIGLQAVMALAQQFFPDIAHILSHVGIFEHGHHHGHSHGDMDFGPNINAAWLAGGSILIKEWLYRATMKIAKEKKSSILASNAYHHRVDSLTAFVALLTICASHFLTNAQWLDPVGGLVISGMIVQAGWGNTKMALLELADVGMDEEMRESVQKNATAALSDLAGGDATLRGVQGIKSGQNFLVDIEVAAPVSWSLEHAAGIEAGIRERVAEKTKGVKRVTVRFVSPLSETETFKDQFVAGPKDGEIEEHDHDHDHAHDHDCSKTTSRQANGSAQKRK
ncbi:Hypothetical protein R9X50_00078700 [Acrodontium crateriforme]|uniref:Cation efflux protein transmembrane domain-containing protein n=1 Tax=Acrodontium crateriforme TaxID=150365 RepID=A0AAQ3R7I3_9PEZI|nr:Hypothetical protein R9X50_00078700 [Acrodontium crateriforme]